MRDVDAAKIAAHIASAKHHYNLAKIMIVDYAAFHDAAMHLDLALLQVHLAHCVNSCPVYASDRDLNLHAAQLEYAARSNKE